MKIYNKALEVFNTYYILQRYSTKDKKRIDDIDKKYLHTMEVVRKGAIVVNALKFNESFVELSKLGFLNHDIGRFEQMLKIGSYIDDDLIKKIGLNHAGLGKQILQDGLIEREIPSTRVYDEPILEIVDKHIEGIVSEKDLLILSSNLLKSAYAIDFFKLASEKEKIKVINAITQIVQDVDRLDIYYQILDGRYIPKKTDQPINPIVMNMFYNSEYLNIVKLKQQGLWNANVGELVRLSFVNQIRLLCVAKLIYDENILMKIKILRQNPYVDDAFDFMQEKLEKKIKKSNGTTIIK